ncbi:MAG: cupin domain-containing protein [Coraliomargarita sp.]
MPKADPLDLCSLVDYQDGQVISRTLAQNKHLNLTVFACAKGEGLSTHSSTGDAMVQVLDGVGILTVDGQDHTVPAGQTIVLPANIPHAVDAPENFKMLLTVVKPV